MNRDLKIMLSVSRLKSAFQEIFFSGQINKSEGPKQAELVQQCRWGRGTLLEYGSPEWDSAAGHTKAKILIVDIGTNSKQSVLLDASELRDVLTSYAPVTQVPGESASHPNIKALRRAASEVQAYDSARHRPAQLSQNQMKAWF